MSASSIPGPRPRCRLGADWERSTSDQTIILADELTLVRESIAHLFESRGGFRVIAQCGDGVKALESIERLTPDIAILDLNLTGLYVMELMRKVGQRDLPTRVILLSIRRDRKLVIEALRGGASGFVLKSGPASHLLEAVTQVAQGGIYVSPPLELNQAVTPTRQPAAQDLIESLSAREYQVFSLLVDGIRAKEIAGRLELSPKTVDTYRASLMRKLDIHDVASLVKFAMHREMI